MDANETAVAYHTVTPYLVIRGVAQVIDFVKLVFGASETFRMAKADGTIGHAEIRIGDSTVMLGEPMAGAPLMPATLYVSVEDVDATYRAALDAGAEPVREPADQFYGDRNAGVRDVAGNQWWMYKHVEDVAPDELMRRAQAAGHGD